MRAFYYEALVVRDALATVAALLRASFALAAERVVPPAGFPRRVGDVDAAWLTTVLQARCPGSRVRRVERLGGNDGTTSRARLALHYDERGPGAPDSVFVKLPPVDLPTRLFVDVMRLGGTEARFYREVAASVPIATPRVFHAASAGRTGRFALVLEDLEARGVAFSDAARPLALDVAKEVVRALATLHASFWESPRLRGDLAWLKRRGSDPTYRLGRVVSATAVRPALRRFADVVPAPLAAAAPRITAARDALEDAWGRGPSTLVHGDAHAGNLYVASTGVGFLDWQVVQCGQGMRDVTYFLVLSLPTDVRRAHERELIALYVATLLERGVAAPMLDHAWEQYRLHAFYAWIAAVVTAAAATLQSEEIVRAGLARSSAALMELDSLALLETRQVRSRSR
jgi:aminoglycoside phosphotransferase (APT) family kinase protein